MEATAAVDRTRRRWLLLVVLCVGQLMIVLDSTVVNVALPAIQRQLHFTQTSLAWVVNAYLLTFGGLLLLAGRIGDLIGRARVFLIGLAAFTAASAICGLAPSSAVLVGARFVQGAAAALVASMVLGIISPMFPEPRERTLALSVFASVAMGGAALGLVLGGLLTDLLSWHWIFFINLPVGAAALASGLRLLPRDRGIGLAAGADLTGALLVTAAPVLLVYGLIHAGTAGWGSATTIGCLAATVVVAGAFVAVEGRVRTPLIPLTVFRHRNLVSATIVRSLFPMGGFGLSFIGALYLQHVLGYSPLRTGPAFLPSTLLTGALSLGLIPRILGRVGPKPLVVAGVGLVTAGLVVMTTITTHSGYAPTVLFTMVLTGAGFGLLFMPSVSIAMSDVDPNESGVASGLTNVAIQLGASVGVALMATVSTSRTAELLRRGRPAAVALTGGYRLGLIVAAGCTAASLLAAVVLLQSVRTTRPPVQGQAVEDEALEAAALAH